MWERWWPPTSTACQCLFAPCWSVTAAGRLFFCCVNRGLLSWVQMIEEWRLSQHHENQSLPTLREHQSFGDFFLLPNQKCQKDEYPEFNRNFRYISCTSNVILSFKTHAYTIEIISDPWSWCSCSEDRSGHLLLHFWQPPRLHNTRHTSGQHVHGVISYL